MPTATWGKPDPVLDWTSTRPGWKGPWLLVLLALILIGGRARAQDKPADLRVAPNEARAALADLLREYRAMGLISLSKDAKFVLINHGTFAFEMEPEKGKQPAKLLMGLEIETPRWLYAAVKRPIDVGFVELNSPDLKKVRLDFPGAWFSYNDSELLWAIQFHAIGEQEVAEFYYKRCQEGAPSPLKNRLAFLAWRHCICELATPNSDRGAIAKHLKALISKYPDLVGEKTHRLIESIDETLKPAKKKEAYIEQLMDGLIDYHCGNYYYWMHTFAEDMTVEIFEQVKKPDEKAIKLPYRIAWQGFDAVPALFGRFEDKRLSRCRWSTPEWLFFDGITHIDNWARFMMYQWVCHPNQKRTWQGEGDDECFHSWWREVKQVGEEAYLVRHVLCDRPAENNLPYPPYLNLLFLKYPKQIPALYKDILANKPNYQSKTVADMIALGPFPKKDKLEWLLQGTKHPELQHRLAAFSALEKADRKRFDEAWLEAMQNNLKKDVHWEHSPFATGIGKLAVLSDDPRVWELLDKVAHAAPLDHLARFLGDFEPDRTRDNQKIQVRFLAKFLPDASAWVITNDLPLSKTIYWGTEIEIRELACLKLAALWEVTEQYQEFSPADWRKFREKIQARLEKEPANK